MGRSFFFAGAEYYPDKIGYSCDLDGDAALLRTFGTPTDNKKWALSFWLLRQTIGSLQDIFTCNGTNGECIVRFLTDNKIRIYTDGNAITGDITTTGTFTSTTAWSHYLIECDAANATAADRMRLTVDNVRQSVTTATTFTDTNYGFNQASAPHAFGRYSGAAIRYLDALVADIRFVDGANPGPSAFGQYSPLAPAVWVPKFSALTYGNNGWQNNFVASGDLGNDISGNNNDFTTEGMTAANQSTTTPTNP